ncbi:MAG: hypothetical protein AAGB26_09990 [Planctomycetota bacterium]
MSARPTAILLVFTLNLTLVGCEKPHASEPTITPPSASHLSEPPTMGRLGIPLGTVADIHQPSSSQAMTYT